MEVKKVLRGQYLFKPGEPVTAMYIVTEGELELSVTVNEKHLHLLKQRAHFHDMEKPPTVPKKNTNLADYGNTFEFDIFNVYGLKNKADVLTVVNNGEVVGNITPGDEIPEHTHMLGDYQ